MPGIIILHYCREMEKVLHLMITLNGQLQQLQPDKSMVIMDLAFLGGKIWIWASDLEQQKCWTNVRKM